MLTTAAITRCLGIDAQRRAGAVFLFVFSL
jgi:hypothetical protein